MDMRSLRAQRYLKMFRTTVASKETAQVTDEMVKPLLNKTEMPIISKMKTTKIEDVANLH